MRPILVALLACSAAACANVQDLGNDRRTAPAPAPTSQPTEVRPVAVATAQPDVPLTNCPSAMPAENSTCSNVAWCVYPLEGANGLAAKCACSLGHWMCLRVRDEHRANIVKTEDLPLTNAACTEGASCEAGTKCKVGIERWCECTSNSRLRCIRPTH